jgi:hypothetical protein
MTVTNRITPSMYGVRIHAPNIVTMWWYLSVNINVNSSFYISGIDISLYLSDYDKGGSLS